MAVIKTKRLSTKNVANLADSSKSRLSASCINNTSTAYPGGPSGSTGPVGVPLTFVIVAGGGSGAQRWTGGGGGGGVIVGAVAAASKGTPYAITVGGGGAAPVYPTTICYAYTFRGVNSSAFCVTAIGGGGGKGYSCYIPAPTGGCVAPGGSGGGGGGPTGPPTGVAPFPYANNQCGSGTQPGQPTPSGPAIVWTNYGNPGGNYNGGGGGASSSGSTRTFTGTPQFPTPGSAGGSGLTVSITGSPFIVAGGGGAGGRYGATQPPNGFVGGPGGPGGGGNGSGYGCAYPRLGSPTPLPGQNGGTNTGGGGGAGSCRAPITPSIGGAGGSGVVYVSVPTPLAGTAGPPSVFTSGPDGAGNTWFKFTSSGTYTA